MSETVTSNVDARGVATVTLNRPQKHNALNEESIRHLYKTFGALGTRSDVRVILLRANGASFCAGGDLDWMKAQFNAPRGERIDQAMALSQMLWTIDRCPKPVVAVVQGNAFGGGVGLISVADVVICSSEAKFSLSETKLGLVPAIISPFVASRISSAMCRALWLSGDVLSAQRALEIGLATKCMLPAGIEESVAQQIKLFLATSPTAVTAAKTLARRFAATVNEEILLRSSELLADLWETPDAQEGISAFLEGRKAVWPSLEEWNLNED